MFSVLCQKQTPSSSQYSRSYYDLFLRKTTFSSSWKLTQCWLVSTWSSTTFKNAHNNVNHSTNLPECPKRGTSYNTDEQVLLVFFFYLPTNHEVLHVWLRDIIQDKEPCTTGLLINWIGEGGFIFISLHMQQERQILHLTTIILLQSDNILFDPTAKLFLRTVDVSVFVLLGSAVWATKQIVHKLLFSSSLYWKIQFCSGKCC